jgi:hypothetical protein
VIIILHIRDIFTPICGLTGLLSLFAGSPNLSPISPSGKFPERIWAGPQQIGMDADVGITILHDGQQLASRRSSSSWCWLPWEGHQSPTRSDARTSPPTKHHPSVPFLGNGPARVATPARSPGLSKWMCAATTFQYQLQSPCTSSSSRYRQKTLPVAGVSRLGV